MQLNLIHYANVFGYSKTVSVLLCMFLVYSYTNILVTQNSFNAIYIYFKEICVEMLICD